MGLPLAAGSRQQNRIKPAPTHADYTGWLSLFVLCGLLGGMLALSFKTQEKLQGSSSSGQDLVEANKMLSDLSKSDQATIKALQVQKSKLEAAMATGSLRVKLLQDDLVQSKFLAGLTEVTGPGVMVTLTDSKKRFPNAPTQIQDVVIVHDSDLEATVNELKSSGAEAVSINDQRLVSTSAIRCAGATIYINQNPETPPFQIRAIGNPKTLQDALNLPQGIADTIREIDPSMISISQIKLLDIPAYSGPTQPKYAKSVPLQGSGTLHTED